MSNFSVGFRARDQVQVLDLKGELDAFQVQIAIGRVRVPSAIAQVNLLVSIENEVVERVMAIVVEQTEIDRIHTRDASTDKLAQQFAAGRFWR